MSSAVGQTTDKRPGHSGQPKTKLGFEISKPIQIGHLRKLGEKGLKSFKRRFFVLYPNFLVYYADAVDWESDKTFQAFRSRKGAIKLQGGSCQAGMKDAVPGESIAPVIIQAPDPTNKRKTYLLDTVSAEEQTRWVEAISGAIKGGKEAGPQSEVKAGSQK